MPRTKIDHKATAAVAKAVSKSAQDIAAEINSALGKSIIKMGNDDAFVTTYLPTGLTPIDVLLGGGVPRGRFTEFYGDFSTLKSYAALNLIANVQAEGGTAMLVDTEHSYDREWAQDIGVDTKALILQQPKVIETGFDAMQVAISNGIDVIVLDSVAASQPKKESVVMLSGDKEMQPARLAALMSTAIRRLNSENSRTALLFINQTRHKIGVMFGSPETTTGGRALSFYSSYRVRFSKAGRVYETKKSWDGDTNASLRKTVKQKVKVELVKSKLSDPEREVWLVWDIPKAELDETAFLVAWGIDNGVLTGARPVDYTEWLKDPATKRQLREMAMGKRSIEAWVPA